MYPAFRSLLFRLEPETAHHLTLQLLRLGGLPPFASILRALFVAPEKPVQVCGLKLRNPVGLAAGYDKDGVALAGLAALGFGHIEIGTVTPRPQPGNPTPRVFRLVEDEGVINRMGFPGQGMEFVRKQVSGGQGAGKAVLGVNLGKNKDTPLEDAAQDYITLLRVFTPLADYLAINISSPNTAGLRRLQGREMLAGLLGAVQRQRLAPNRHVPVLVKIAPDLNEEELDDAVGVILDTGMDGIIATNTTLSRDGLKSRHRGESGGLSGKPLTGRSEAVLTGALRRVGGRVPIISAGGIMTPDDAKRRLDMGAALVQLYTGLVYAGPGLVKAIVRKI